jgi:uroporphyrinogen decarboxylase
MTGRERFLKAVDHEEPDIVPVFANLSTQVAEALGKQWGLPYKSVDSFLSDRISFTEILLELGNDAVGVGATRGKRHTIRTRNGIIIDEWNFKYRKVGPYVEIIDRPLSNVSTIKEIEAYEIPDPNDENRWTLASHMIEKHCRKYAIIGCMGMTMFEMGWNLVGFEKFLIDFNQQEPYVLRLLDRLLNYALDCGKRLLDLGVDVLWTGDDVGTQNGMLISPEIWRGILKPRMSKLYSALKEKNRDIKIAYHSCGSIVPIIPDLIEIGLDILNPIQPLAREMDLRKLKEEYGTKICLFGGVDVQNVLPLGRSEEIEKHVKDRIDAAASGGGFIIAPAHVIQPDTKIENVKVFFSAVKRYGRYPLDL